MIPRDGSDALFARDVRQILRASEVGIRWADNIGPVVQFQYRGGRAPYRVRVRAKAPPQAVFVLRAFNHAGLTVESGCRVTWKWGNGTLDVKQIDVTDPLALYEVTLGLMME